MKFEKVWQFLINFIANKNRSSSKESFFLFHPRIIDTIREGYTFPFFRKDLFSGLTVAIVAIPLSIAFSIASGSTPMIGILTAIIGGLIVSFFGGSKYNISGPAGAFIGVIFSTIEHFSYNGLLISTFLAGIFLMIFGTLKLGRAIKKIPHCIVIGFGVGLGIDIFSGQLVDFFGITTHGGVCFIARIANFINHFNQSNLDSFVLGVITIICVLAIRYVKDSLPAFLIAIIISCVIAKAFGFHVETIFSRFGEMNLSFPKIQQNVLEEIEHPLHFLPYIGASLTIAILAGIEALLAATIADKMNGGYHRPNTELFALGIANCVSAIFGCLPIAGTTARTIVNVKSGAKSPIAGVFHGVFLIILTAIFGCLISGIGMPAIAGILIVVSIDMMSFKKVIAIFKTKQHFDIFMMLFTIFCVLSFGIVVAIIANTIVWNICEKVVARVKNQKN